MQAQQLKQEFVATFVRNGEKSKADWDKNLALLINKHVCLVFSSFTITLFPI